MHFVLKGFSLANGCVRYGYHYHLAVFSRGQKFGIFSSSSDKFIKIYIGIFATYKLTMYRRSINPNSILKDFADNSFRTIILALTATGDHQ